jgi:16S rRNA (adenine1518-N6/adenine1519-N6)-dimethyltransferase
MRAKQQLGQNFLMHAATARRIVVASKVAPGSHVLEIGPGTGMLTRELLDAGLLVTAIETDRELIPVLEELFAHEIQKGSLMLIHGDIRTFDLSKLTDPYAVIANIPYYITGEIISITTIPAAARLPFLVN